MTQELRKLAAEWIERECDENDIRFDGGSTSTNKLMRAYIAAANPAAILALLDRLEKAEKDAERYRWLRDRYMAVDFDWQGQQAVIFTADDFPIATASCDETIDRAMEASK